MLTGRSLLPMFCYLALSVFMVDAKAADFTLESYFKGKTYATGSFSAINGVQRHFTVILNGRWKNQTLSLQEDFTFDDGTKETKTWHFKKMQPGLYFGTREDVVGETVVRIEGDTAHFTYLVNLSPDNQVRFYDTMVLHDGGTVENTAWVTKYGFPVARTRVNFSHP